MKTLAIITLSCLIWLSGSDAQVQSYNNVSHHVLDDATCQQIRVETNYRNADLPDLFFFRNGTRVRPERRAWEERRQEIKTLLLRYFYGTLPAEVPPLVDVSYHASRTSQHDGGLSQYMGQSQHITLTFQVLGRYNVSFVVEVLRPVAREGSSSSTSRTATTHKWPLVLTQTNHRRWALKALSRGYVALVYPGADIDDASERFAQVYENNNDDNNTASRPTWGVIVRRAWLASRCLDFILEQSYIDTERVSIVGHSRNGKQSMLAAALDDRFTSVVASSSGTPGMCASRSTSPNSFAESVGDAPDDWWAPALSCFRGHEDRLPMDSHGLLALIAPRHFLSATGWTDGCEPTWAVERTYQAAKKVYNMFLAWEKDESDDDDDINHQANNIAEARLRIQYRPGQHHGFLDVDGYFDWFDYAGKVPGYTQDLFPEVLLHGFDWHAWSRQNLDRHAPPSNATRLETIQWGLGDGPVAVFESPGGNFGEQCEASSTGCYISEMMTHNRYVGTAQHVAKAEVNFGEYISASVYFPCEPEHFHPVGNGELLNACTTPPSNLPVVIWLHPLSYHTGYNEGYIKSESGTAIYFALAKAGFAVICFDMAGFGTRLRESILFYRRYPNWSLLGKLVADGLAAVDLVTAASLNQTSQEPPIGLPGMNADQVFVVGYDIGGRTALYVAAFDDRIKGVVSVNGWTPMRQDSNHSTTGGIRRLWDWHALQPVLGFYDGKETSLPFDMEDVLIEATRKGTARVLIYQQSLDRENNAHHVHEAVERARSMGAQNVDYQEPNCINMLNDAVHDAIVAWLKIRLLTGGDDIIMSTK